MKKAILALLVVCLLVALTGCGCKHESTEVRGVVQATCDQDGYTGDTFCLECEEPVEKGTVVPARGHQLTDTMNYSDSTCAREGYTGDIYCNFCGERVVTGETIAKKEHTPGELVRVREADCWDEGYTGDIDCTVCGTTIEMGEFTEALGHTPGERVDAYEATCSSWGYTGNIVCSVCGDYIEWGEDIEPIAHTPGELTGVMEATCASPGYTGDGYCVNCERFIEGQTVEQLEHAYENGVCTACGWKEAGLYIDGQLAFSWDQLIQNSYVSVNEDNGLEAVVKSLYGQLVVAEGVYLDAYNIFEGCQLESLWLPSSVTRVPSSSFANNATLAEVKFFGRVDYFGDYAFAGNTALAHIDIPVGLTYVGYHAFTDCTGLKSVTIPEGVTSIGSYAFSNTGLLEVTLPSTLEEIDYYAFANCPSLTALEIPEGVTYIGDGIVQGSAVGKLVLPSTLTSMGAQQSTNLMIFDLSKAPLTKLYDGAIGYNANLKTVILPETLEYIEDTTLRDCTAIEILDLPDKLTSIGDDWGGFEGNTGITTIIWPVSLTDGTTLTALPNLTTIFYKGSELQWDLTASRDMFEGKTIIFDYVEQ